MQFHRSPRAWHRPGQSNPHPRTTLHFLLATKCTAATCPGYSDCSCQTCQRCHPGEQIHCKPNMTLTEIPITTRSNSCIILMMSTVSAPISRVRSQLQHIPFNDGQYMLGSANATVNVYICNTKTQILKNQGWFFFLLRLWKSLVLSIRLALNVWPIVWHNWPTLGPWFRRNKATDLLCRLGSDSWRLGSDCGLQPRLITSLS